MKTFSEIKPGLLKRSSLALGFFDGVHPGHQAVIKKAVEEAFVLEATPALITFREHPRAITQGKAPALLTLPEQRLELCEKFGIEAVLLLSFTEELCRLSPRDYVQQVLLESMGAVSLSVGFNHRFGRNREGDPNLLQKLGKEMGFKVHIAQEIDLEGELISSTRIRETLELGDLELTRKILGRPYSIFGTVVHGDGRGKQIGFPTANLRSPANLIIPANGVYSGFTKIDSGEVYPCIINIGNRPTFGTSSNIVTEVHIFDFSADLYDKQISVRFMHPIRKEKKFTNIDELKNQIINDCQQARAKLASESARESAQFWGNLC